MHFSQSFNKSVGLESIWTWCNKIFINRNISNLNRATSLFTELKLYHFFRQRNKAIDDLSSFTTFYKRDGGNQFSNARYRREALEDLGAFTTFMKKNKPFNEAAPSIGKRSSRHSREALLDSLGTFSSFMSPHQYYKRVRVLVLKQPVQRWALGGNYKHLHEMFHFHGTCIKKNLHYAITYLSDLLWALAS